MAEDGPPQAATAASTMRTDVYIDRERHLAELAAIASKPAATALSGDIATPGDFVTVEIAGKPLIVTRASDGGVHAMHNSCAHRGATVESRERGSARVLSCKFHAWSYNLDGELRAVADKGVFSATPCTRGLRPVQCEERHGIIWVTADPSAPMLSVRDWLGSELDDLLASLQLDTMIPHAVTDLEVSANWKLLTDGFLELYHLKYLHRQTIAPYFPANLTRPLRFGQHLGNAIPKNRMLQDLANQPRDEWQVYRGTTMPIVLMPGTVIEWQAGHVEVFSLRPDPTDPGRTQVRLWLAVPADRADESDLWDRNWERVVETVTDEDFAVAEDVQRNVQAGVADELLIGANEELLLEHMAAVDQLVSERC